MLGRPDSALTNTYSALPPHAQLHHGKQSTYATQPDLLLFLHAAYQSACERAELRHIHAPSYAGTYEQPINDHFWYHLNSCMNKAHFIASLAIMSILLFQPIV
ncbi:hypothetical protein D9C73_004100 [Collichthys lucidus]|uniref:Uncharacterized protein n=1 Tax=Collichthys lucidus TaxID=240159 RepID=A0A4U5U6Z6_COLLU|nr:hypothetical protein D9C73_004100 [Collichthys lucidus]